MNRTIGRAVHFLQRIQRETKRYPKVKKLFGVKVAKATFKDGLFPPGKSEAYIKTIEEYVDNFMEPVLKKYEQIDEQAFIQKKLEQPTPFQKMPVWCCWWQGEDSMPELVKMCNHRLQSIIPADRAEYHLITMDNLREYADFPPHIWEKYHAGKITMTNLSDMLRAELLSRYGGMWIDATVFLSDKIPEQFFTERFFSQKMFDMVKCQREACKGRWCGFMMAMTRENIIYDYLKEAFYYWWEHQEDIVDYVLIDYLILAAYKRLPYIRALIDQVPNNNEGVFAMYQVMNQPYTDELYEQLTKDTCIHKLTYKENNVKVTADGKQTLYGHLIQEYL